MMEVFQHLEHQAKYHIEWIGEVKKATTGEEYVVRVYWQGLGDEESSLELVYGGATCLIKGDYVSATVKESLKVRYVLTCEVSGDELGVRVCLGTPKGEGIVVT